MFSLKDLQDMYAKIDYGIHHHRRNQKAYQQHTNHERNLKNGKHAAAIRKGKFPWAYHRVFINTLADNDKGYLLND